MHQHRPGMYQKSRSVGQLSGVPAGKSGDTGGWKMGAAVVGVLKMVLKALQTDVCLPLTMVVNLALICWP